jgi:hypothetical protein
MPDFSAAGGFVSVTVTAYETTVVPLPPDVDEAAGEIAATVPSRSLPTASTETVAGCLSWTLLMSVSTTSAVTW